VAALVVAAAVTLFILWLRNPERIAAAEGQHAIDKHLAEPLDMTAKVQTPASYFEKIESFPAWKFVPIGPQTFCHIPLQIDGMICLWGEGGVKKGLTFPEVWPDIPLNQKFETLYVYHSSFFESPHGTPVYQIVFRYDDGSSATNQVVYGEDVYDWTAGHKFNKPTAARSKTAWTGMADLGKKKQPLQFFLTAVENPNPDLTVITIDLYSCKNRTAACILAFTPGKSGLMK
jgi:hypothetical protein